MKKLKISPDLSFPADIVTRKTVVYGGNGMGKSNLTIGVLPEELHRLGLRFCVLDPMGVGWGLQHGSHRGEDGIDVLILGGPHGDIEIDPTAGPVVADLVADESVSTVVDFSRTKAGKGWSKGEKIRFVADFCARLHERQAETRRPILVIMDEAARFIPQLIPHGSPDVARCVGAVEMLAEEGRNLAVGMVFVTPRSARMNKSVSELADTMIAFRTVGPNSVGAVMDWLGEHIEKERHRDIVGKLRTLPVGSALVVSPGWLEHEGVVRFRPRRTFDSSATPGVGVITHAPSAATKPDLTKYRERMAATIEKAKADNTKELRAEIALLKRQRTEEFDKRREAEASAATAKESIKEKRIDIPILKDSQIERIDKLSKRYESVAEKLREALKRVEQSVDVFRNKKTGAPLTQAHAVYPLPMPKIMPNPPIVSREHTMPRVSVTVESGEGLPNSARRILQIAASRFPLRLTKSQLATLAGVKPGGTVWNVSFAILKRQGLIIPSGNEIVLTDRGISIAGTQIGDHHADVVEMWRSKLPSASRKMFDFLVSMRGRTVNAQAIAYAMGDIKEKGTVFNVSWALLKRNRLVEKEGDEYRISEALWA